MKKPKRTSQQNRRPTPLTLNLPFISDTFNHNVRRILDRHNIPARPTNRRSTTILQLATKTNTPNTTCRSKTCPSPTICQLTNVVYEATCTLCQQTYIGQTRRKLHDRIREHTNAARKHDNTSAFGEHYANTHPNTTTPTSPSRSSNEQMTHYDYTSRKPIRHPNKIPTTKPTRRTPWNGFPHLTLTTYSTDNTPLTIHSTDNTLN